MHYVPSHMCDASCILSHPLSSGTLLRCLSDTPLIRREAFFQEIRSCRRRPRREWQQSSIVPLFTHGDWLSLVEFRSIMTAVRTRIRARGLRLMDAFKGNDMLWCLEYLMFLFFCHLPMSSLLITSRPLLSSRHIPSYDFV